MLTILNEFKELNRIYSSDLIADNYFISAYPKLLYGFLYTSFTMTTNKTFFRNLLA